MEWLRSKQYIDYFESLDKDGGFFYERWGDAPVHSIAAGLMLNKSEIHFFNDIAYWHVPFTHCPTGEKTRLDLRCHCDPKENFDWKGYSCKAPADSPLMTIVSKTDFFENRHIQVLRGERHGEARGLGKPKGLEEKTIIIHI